MDIQTIILGITALVTALTPILLALINRKAAKTLESQKESRAEQRVVAASAATKVEAVRTELQESATRTAEKVDTIHGLVNSQLTEAVNRFKQALVTIDELKAVLVRLAPDDPRVRDLLKPDPEGDGDG